MEVEGGRAGGKILDKKEALDGSLTRLSRTSLLVCVLLLMLNKDTVEAKSLDTRCELKVFSLSFLFLSQDYWNCS